MKHIFIIQQEGRIMFVCRSLLLVYKYLKIALPDLAATELLSYSQYARKFEGSLSITILSRHTGPISVHKKEVKTNLTGAQMPLLAIY